MQSFLDTVYNPDLVDTRASAMDAAMQGNVAPDYATWKPEVAKMRDYMVQNLAAEREIVAAACQ